VTREQALEPLQQLLAQLLAEADLPDSSRHLFELTLQRTVRHFDDVAQQRQDEQVRQAGSALYHLASAIFMAWEACRQAPDYRRLALAHLVLQHKLLPRDPLGSPPLIDAALLANLANERPLSLAEAMQLLPA
jgi:hypothetical protein